VISRVEHQVLFSLYFIHWARSWLMDGWTTMKRCTKSVAGISEQLSINGDILGRTGGLVWSFRRVLLLRHLSARGSSRVRFCNGSNGAHSPSYKKKRVDCSKIGHPLPVLL